MCSGARWKWSDSRSHLYCNPHDGTDCKRDCCTELPSCASTACVAENGWRDGGGNKADLYCDATDGTPCEEDCCDS
eukprot:g18012.t1